MLAGLAILLVGAIALLTSRSKHITAGPVPTSVPGGVTTRPPPTAPPTTRRPSPTNLYPTPPAMVAPVGLVQQWATALVAGDWATARRIAPSMASRSDTELAAGYGGLKSATIIYLNGNSSSFNVASVAHEDIAGALRTNVYCFTISANLNAGTITTQNGRPVGSPYPGWVGPESVTGAIDSCR